jgi:hypothetical protein
MARQLEQARLMQRTSQSQTTPLTRPWRPAALASLLGAVAIAACGSSVGSASRPAAHATLVAFSACMRTHGVPGFPDPGNGALNLSGSGIDSSSPAFRAAQGRCQKLLPSGGRPWGADEQAKLRLLALARCMRSHGLSSFPDPMVGRPPPNLGTYGLIRGIGDAYLAVPRSVGPSTPAFRFAATACRLAH